MTSFLRTICLILILGFLFMTGLYLLVPYSDFLSKWLSPVFALFLWSERMNIAYKVIMLLLPILYVLFVLLSGKGKENYVITGKDGNSSISEGTIIKSLISSVRSTPSVVKVKPVIHNERNGLHVVINTQIKLDRFVPNICDHVRKRAKNTLTGVLGIERIVKIDVNIGDVKISHAPLPEKMKKESPAPAAKPAAAPAGSVKKPSPSSHKPSPFPSVKPETQKKEKKDIPKPKPKPDQSSSGPFSSSGPSGSSSSEKDEKDKKPFPFRKKDE